AVVAGGVSCAGVCDEATSVKQMSMRAELLSRSKRLLRMDMIRRSSPTSIHHGEKQRRMQDRRSLAGAKPGRPGSSMPGDGRWAWLEEGALRCYQIECNSGLEPKSVKNARQRQRRSLGRHNCAGEMDQRADRAEMVREVVMTDRAGRRIGLVTWRLLAG